MSLPVQYYEKQQQRTGQHRHYRRAANGVMESTFVDQTVAQGAPELLSVLGQWIDHVWAGRKEQIRVLDRVTVNNGVRYVRVERRYPWTGGLVSVAHVMNWLPKPKPCTALGFPICTAIVVYKEKAAG